MHGFGRNQCCCGHAVIALNDRQRRLVVNRDQDDRAELNVLGNLDAKGTQLRNESVIRVREKPRTDATGHVEQQKSAASIAQPLVAGKDARPFDVVVRKLNFPPFGVARELAPEAAAAAVQ